MEYIRSIKDPKELVFEKCELSAWLYEILHNEVDELVVCNPTRNLQYKKAKTDKLDARNLALLVCRRDKNVKPHFFRDKAP